MNLGAVLPSLQPLTRCKGQTTNYALSAKLLSVDYYLILKGNIISTIRMLDEKEKLHILEEERYRVEIRRQLEEKKPVTKSGKIWTFVNSSFGIWLLSTVIIGLATFLYGQYQTKIDRSKLHSDLKRKLNVEISYKINSFYQATKTCQSSSSFNENMFEDLPYYVGTRQSRSEETPITYIFTEFKGRTLKSLFFEYGSLLEEEESIETNNASKKMDYILSNIDRVLQQLNQDYLKDENYLKDKNKQKYYKSIVDKYIYIIDNDPILKGFCNQTD